MLAVGVSSAIHSWMTAPCSAHMCPNADRPPSVSNLFAVRIGARRFHSSTACLFFSHFGGGGTAVSVGSSTAGGAARLG